MVTRNLCPVCHPEAALMFGPLATYALCDEHFAAAVRTADAADIAADITFVKLKDPTHG